MEESFHFLKPKNGNEGQIQTFLYEVDMLNGTYKLLGLGNLYQRNSAIESYLLHARNLIDFFEDNRNPKYNDDLTCVDFKNVDGAQILGKSLKFSKDFKKNISKFLAHMTKVRAEQSPNWHLDKVHKVLNIEVRSFLEKCSSDYFSSLADKNAYLDKFTFDVQLV